ncbi:hypothetical protein DFH08DRAFT_857943 [Mycena albidolilacea]|uniref:Uncharacterized protein n=1 Tax=Mycena albidolilacea TaxID=1033008 RepID=A0AAD7A8M5_9AGAR|nr:hypothetical protein DFH08DRAFT_857943 [Mycena albidolilacea]
MSIPGLPSRPPSYYSIEPAPSLHEQHPASNTRSLPPSRPTANFVKSSDYGDVKLRLAAQDNKLDLPVYSGVSTVEGTVEIANTNNISSVQVKVEGTLGLSEYGKDGHKRYTLCSDTVVVWTKYVNGRSYLLPPSHSVKLKGIPGFNAVLAYSISAKINKTTIIHVSTPFIYYPRTRPPSPLPFPMYCTEAGIFEEQPAWNAYQSIAKANAKSGVQDIGVKLYLPASRIFCASQGIPFHITMESDAHSLAVFLPYAPVAGKSGATRIQLMRQSTVDVKFKKFLTAQGERSDTAIWRVDYIGEAAFRDARDSPSRMSFSGEITIEPTNVMGFAVPGLTVQVRQVLYLFPGDCWLMIHFNGKIAFC